MILCSKSIRCSLRELMLLQIIFNTVRSDKNNITKKDSYEQVTHKKIRNLTAWLGDKRLNRLKQICINLKFSFFPTSVQRRQTLVVLTTIYNTVLYFYPLKIAVRQFNFCCENLGFISTVSFIWWFSLFLSPVCLIMYWTYMYKDKLQCRCWLFLGELRVQSKNVLFKISQLTLLIVVVCLLFQELKMLSILTSPQLLMHIFTE